MDVAGFVGLCTRGPVGVAVALESWSDFKREFGRPGGGRRLPEAVHHFFLNGGRRCVVVRTLNAGGAKRAGGLIRALVDDDASPLAIQAADPGGWGNALGGRLRLRRRAIGARTVEEGGDDELLVWDRSIVPGTLLRWTRGPDWSSPGPAVDDLDEAFFFVVNTDERDGRHLLTLHRDVEPPLIDGDEGRIRGRLEVVNVDAEIRIPGDREERFERLGLHGDHPRFVAKVINGESRLVRLDSPGRLYPNFGADDRIAVTEPGTDAAAETTRADFFARLEREYDGRLAVTTPLDALLEYEQGMVVGDDDERIPGHELDPISLVAIPDLVHPPREWVDASREPAEQIRDDEPLRFQPCDELIDDDESLRGVEPQDYPKLAADWSGPDASAPENSMRRLVDWCEEHGRSIAVLDLPPGLTSGEMMRLREQLRSVNAAVYGPWLRGASAADPQGPLIAMPPSGAVCGVVAKSSRDGGHAAPMANLAIRGFAGRHEASRWSSKLLFDVRVNEIRRERGQLRLMGSRTTGGDARQGHLSVQRVLQFLYRQIPVDTRWAVFEPNGHRLWRRLTRVLSRRLVGLYAANALEGEAASDAFFVDCDATTNTQTDVDEGRVVARIGVAPAVPAEFIHLQIALVSDGRVVVEGGR